MEKLNLHRNNKDLNTEGEITHNGVITAISTNSIKVSLLGNIHCDGCNAKSACELSEHSEKTVEVYQNPDSFSLHEQVRVALRKDLGFKAVFWAYVFPFMLLITVLLAASNFVAEWLAGVLATAVLIPYYVIIYSMKDFFKRNFSVAISKYVES